MNGVLLSAAEGVAETEEIANWFVCAMGLGTVFVGLIALILLCGMIGFLFRRFGGGAKAAPAEAETPAAPVQEEIPNRQELVAAISAALAEEMGTDVAGLRILSIRRM